MLLSVVQLLDNIAHELSVSAAVLGEYLCKRMASEKSVAAQSSSTASAGYAAIALFSTQ